MFRQALRSLSHVSRGASKLASRGLLVRTHRLLQASRSVTTVSKVSRKMRAQAPVLGARPQVSSWTLRQLSSAAGGAVEEVPVPPLGDSITEGTVSAWNVEVGEFVEEDGIVCVVETDKVAVDIRTPVAGTVTELCAEEDDTVDVGAVLLKIQPGDAPEGGSKKEEKKEAKKEEPKKEEPKKEAAPKKEAPKKKEAAPKKEEAKPAGGSRDETRVPMTRMRMRIAERLKESQNTTAMLTTFNEIDMSGLMDMRSKHKDAFLEKHGVKLGFMSAFVRASTLALQANPDINAVIDGKDIVYRDYVDVSVAVATPTGLVVPVLRNTETMGFHDIEANIADLGARARDGKLALEDMTGGTFTISNGGVYGSLMGTPIINLPQSAILGMHGIVRRPVAVGNDIEIRPMMYVALTYDHRLIDGRGAVTFLRTIKDHVEDPTRMLLDL